MKAALRGHSMDGFAYPDGSLRTVRVDPSSGTRVSGQCPSVDAIDEIFTGKNAPRDCQ